ncbi:MAG TPA: hypothetical protein VIX15_02205, partial [Streptosporangiaceae bacterium]
MDQQADADGVSGRPGAEDDYYGQLLRRPDEFQPRPRLRQQGRPRLRQPGRFAPPGTAGYPAGGPGNGDLEDGWTPMGGRANGGAGNVGSIGSPGNGGPMGGPGSGGPAGGPGNGGLIGGPGTGRPMGGPGNGGSAGGLGNGGLIGGPG